MQRVRITGRVEAPLERVERAVLDPATLPLVAARAPMIAAATLLELSRTPSAIARRVRMRAALAPPLFLRVVEGEHLEWVETVVWDPRAHEGRFTVVPNLVAARRDQLRCEGVYRLVAEGAALTRREVEAEIEVRARGSGAPGGLVARTVEHLVARALGPQMDAELAVLRERCEARGDVPSSA